MRYLILLAVFYQTLNVSAYCHTGNPTASGKWPVAYVTCAADHLPFGTKVYLPDGRLLIVTDRFGDGRNNSLDIFLPTEAECWQFGRRWLMCKVEIP